MRSKRRPRRPPLRPFGSPRSQALTLARQAERIISGRMDWGTPVNPVSANTWQYTRVPAEVDTTSPPDKDHDHDQDQDQVQVQVQVQDQRFRPSFRLYYPNPLPDPPAIRFPVYRCPSETMAANIGALSPSSSPRLPSPPPFPEVQIGPRSPTINASANITSPGLPNPGTTSPIPTDPTKLDDGATRRIRPGTKAADMASGPPLVPLAEVSSIIQQN